MNIIFSGEKCTGCRLCSLACSGNRIGAFSETHANIGISSSYHGDDFLITPRLCNHCNTCVENCPSEALHYEGDIITLSREKCTSCGLCRDSCPQHVIYMWEDYPVLCNLCDMDPWCVKICPKEALGTQEVKP